MAQAKIKMIPGRKAGITSCPAFNAPQKTSAAFIVGAPVKLSSGVLVAPTAVNNVIASSTVTFVSKSSTANVLGISMGKAAASSTNRLVVARIQEGLEFIGNLVHATASSAKVSKIGSTVYLGKQYVSASSADTHWGWSLSSPTSSAASYINGVITGLVDPASTVNGRVLVAIKKGGGLFV